MKQGSLTTAKPDWLKGLKNREFTLNGLTYKERDSGTHQCLIVRDYVNLIDDVNDFNELLCVPSHLIIIIDLGDAAKGHNLIINPESGTVYVNSHPFNAPAGLQSLGDGSWGIVFNTSFYKPEHRFINWLCSIYDLWLREVYCKLEHFGLIEHDDLHERSIWHIITNDLPKGKILAKIHQN